MVYFQFKPLPSFVSLCQLNKPSPVLTNYKVPNQTKIVPSQTNKAPSQTNKVQNQTKPAKFQTKQIKFQTKPTKFQTNKFPNQQSSKPNQQSLKLCCYCYCIKPTSRYKTRVWKISHIPVKKLTLLPRQTDKAPKESKPKK